MIGFIFNDFVELRGTLSKPKLQIHAINAHWDSSRQSSDETLTPYTLPPALHDMRMIKFKSGYTQKKIHDRLTG